MRVAAENREKFTKTPYFGGSKSLKVIVVDISKNLVASPCCDKQHICNHFHLRRANSGKITFLRGCFFFAPLFVGIPFTQRHEILSRNTIDSGLSYGENPNVLSHLVLNWYRVVTDEQTDGWPELP